MSLCKCGCNRVVKLGRQFINGHNRRGMHHTKETIEKQIKLKLGKNNPMFNVKGLNHFHYGKRGEDTTAWKGGYLSHKGLTPQEAHNYDDEENRELIRIRDSFICQHCGKTQEENGRRLDVHHVDSDARNNASENLISLCRSCHWKTIVQKQYSE